MRTSWFYVSAALLSFSCVSVAPAIAATRVTFLGSDPRLLAPSPIAIADVAGGAIDAAGNGYYADERTGTILRLTPTGNVTTLLSGLKQPHLAVDYRGNVYVSDTGNNRVLALAAGATRPVTRAQMPGPGSIAADASGNVFFLSGGSLYEATGTGTPRKIAAFPNALLLAYGPANGENDTIYVLSTKPNVAPSAGTAGPPPQYVISTYAYHNATGSVAAGPAFETTDTIDDFGVDAGGNLIFAAVTRAAGVSQPRTYLFEITTAGDNLALTQPVAGSTIRLALDYNRTIYYADAQGVYQLTKGAIDFGPASQQSGSGAPVTLTLNFSLPTGVAVASTSYVVDGTRSDDFQDGFPFNASCSAGASVCSMPVTYLPAELGPTAAIMSLLDANGNALVQVPLHGVGVYPMHEMFAAQNIPYPDNPFVGSLKDPAGICTSTSLGPMVTDIALNTVFTPYSSAFSESVSKPQTVAHYPAGNTYITQSGQPGVLVIHQDQSMTRVATRLATEPNGVGVDGAGNLYISDRNLVFRVGVDGVETQLAGPTTDGGYTSVQSIAVDPGGDAYAYFASGGPEGRGGLIRITPAGISSSIETEAASAAGLALDIGGGLYFSDSTNKSLGTLRTDGTWMTLLTGLHKPRGITALYGPLLVDEGTKQLLAPAMPASAFDFGNVPVGTTVTKTFTVFALGNAQSTGDIFFDGFDSAFSSGSGYRINPGESGTVTISFTPAYAGPHSATLFDEANDFFSEQPIVQQYSVTGVGMQAPAITTAR